MALEGLGTVANVIAVVDLTAKIASTCVQYSRDVKNARTDIDRVKEVSIALQDTARSASMLLSGPNGYRLKHSQQLLGAIVGAATQLETLNSDLDISSSRKRMSRLGFRALKWPFRSREVEMIVQNMIRCTQAISIALQVDQTLILLDLDQKSVLDRLPTVLGASFDSNAEEHNPTCLPTTRVELLKEITRWVNDPNAKAVFWLNGMAGTGKSTISRTVARSLAETNHLGASFFFKRGEADRSHSAKFITTIASQLVIRLPPLGVSVKKAIDADPAIHTKALQVQFDKLILEPMLRIKEAAYKGGSIAIVVDALDECEEDDDIKLFIKLFSDGNSIQCPRLKILVTSRPELPVRLGFVAVQGTYDHLTLHQIPGPIIKRDILAFLEYELGRIRDEYNGSVSIERQLSSKWPGLSNVQTLVDMAVPLFIFAATTCRFLSQRRCGSPDQQLLQVLEYGTGLPTLGFNLASKLEAIYRPALDRQLIDLTPSEIFLVLKEFRYIVGSIIVLSSPLSTAALGKLLDIPIGIVENRLDILQSVLSVPGDSTSPVRLLHLSFRDFLVDTKQQAKNPFWINEKEVHHALAIRCLAIMKNYLHANICDLQTPGTLRQTVSIEKIDACLPPEVQYACRYWTYHTKEADIEPELFSYIYNFFTCNLLHWLEALSLMGKAFESLQILENLKLLDKHALLEFVSDASRFIRSNLSIIDAAPLQLYSSALVFTPQQSIIRHTFKNNIPDWIELQPHTETNWDYCLQKLEGHTDAIHLVAFSHDSSILASVSYDKTVRIWSTDTGECIKELKGHTHSVNSVAFSHNSAILASASYDKTVRIWLTKTGECTQKLSGHSDSVHSVAFSHDSVILASASYDKTIRIWVTDTGECIQQLKGCCGPVTSVDFSHNSALLASASYDKTIRVWRIDTGECTQILYGHESSVQSVVFSHDSTLLASASDDETVCIWATNTGECKKKLKGYGGPLKSVVFSHNSLLLASASDDKTVRIWRTETGECIQKLLGHGAVVNSVAFSHNSALLASASHDNTIRIWRIDTSKSNPNPTGRSERHSDRVNSVAFSHDAVLLASASDDQKVRVWRTDTGECTQELKGHSGSIHSVAFSHDSTLLASASDDKTIRIWCTETAECTQELKGHSDSVRAIAFSHDSALLASASNDKTARIWCTGTGECIQELKGHKTWVKIVVFSQDSSIITSTADDETTRSWRTGTGECIQEIQGYIDLVKLVTFSHDAAFLALTSGKKEIQVWRTDTGERMQEFYGQGDSVRSVVFSHDSTLLASASDDKTIWVWRIDTGECIQKLQGHIGPVQCVTFSHDSTLIASASHDKTVRVWCTTTGECTQSFIGHTGPVELVSFSPDSTLVASTSHDMIVWVWRTNTGECIQKLKGHSGWVRSIAFSQGSVLLASASDDKTVRVWRTDTGECIQNLRGHSRPVHSVAFSLDPTFIASVSYDKSVRIWRSDTGDCTQSLKGYGYLVRSVAISPHSVFLAPASYDETARKWCTNTSERIQVAEIGVLSSLSSFNPCNAHLVTEVGASTINKVTSHSPSQPLPVQLGTISTTKTGIGISLDNCWITWNGCNVFWLPIEFRPLCSAVLGSAVVIGSSSGRVFAVGLLNPF